MKRRGLFSLFGMIFLSIVVVLGGYFVSSEMSFDERGRAKVKQISVLWLGADTHVGHPNKPYTNELSTAIKDVNSLGSSKYAVILGDCIDERASNPSREWDRFVSKMNNLNHNWTYVLGNHDLDGLWPSNPVTKPNWFSMEVNGLRIMGISDEHINKNLEKNELQMSKEQKDWFKSVLNEDPDMPTVVMSHQHLTRIPFYSDWIKPNMDDYNIIYWIHGHVHRWGFSENVDGKGFNILNIGNILYDEESAFMFVKNDGEVLEISFQFRSHANSRWIQNGASVDGIDTVDYDKYKVQISLEPQGCSTNADCSREAPYEICFVKERICLKGDVNNDGNINMDDFSEFIKDFISFKENGWSVNLRRSDFNYDDRISMADYSIFVQSYRIVRVMPTP